MKKKDFLFLLLALVVATGTEWAPYYVSLFAKGHLTLLGHPGTIEPCSAAPQGASACRGQYTVTAQALKTTTSLEAVGFGVLLHSADVICKSTGESLARFGDPLTAGKNLDAFNTYQMTSWKGVHCPSDLSVRIWAPGSYRRYGHIGAAMVAGDLYSVDRVKKLVQFFRSDLLLILTALFSCIFLFNRILIRVSGLKSEPETIERYTIPWLCFMLIYSGLPSTLVPVETNSYWFTRLANFFSILAHFGFCIFGISRSKVLPALFAQAGAILIRPLRPRIPISIWHLAVAAFVLSPFFAIGMAPFFVALSVVTILLGLAERNSMLLVLGISEILGSVKLYSIPYLPEGYITLTLVLFFLSDVFLSRVRKSARFVGSLQWARNLFLNMQTMPFDETLKAFCERYGIVQASYFNIQDGQRCEIAILRQTADGWQKEAFFRDEVPHMFSHVITTRESLWHVWENSLMALDLRKGLPSTHAHPGEVFTILPLVLNASPIGAVAFTGYKADYANDPYDRLEFETVLNSLIPFLVSSMSQQQLNGLEAWDRACLDAAARISSTNNHNHESLDPLLKQISDSLNAAVFLATLDPSSRALSVVATAGYSAEADTAYRNTKFFAVSHNEQGPIPLAVNRRQIVTVPDVFILKKVLHGITLKVFEAAGTRSCAVVPLFDSHTRSAAGSGDPCAILWFESRERGRFNGRIENGLRTIGASVEAVLDKISLVDQKDKASKVLEGFLPGYVREKIMAGQPIREVDRGYLLMADMRDSTALSRAVGADRWISFMQEVEKNVRSLALEEGYRMQFYIWDALFLTKTQAFPTQASVTQTKLFAEKLNDLLVTLFNRQFDPSLLSNSASRARFCLTFGDVTRDLSGGARKEWTIVGGTFPAIHKLEQAAKTENGWFFATESSFSGEPLATWRVLNATVKGTGEKIFSYDEPIVVQEPDRTPTPVLNDEDAMESAA